MAHVSLHRQTINGPFPTPASVDENWTKLQNGHNDHDDRIVTAETNLAAVESFMGQGAPCVFFDTRFTITAVAFVVIPLPDPATWDEVEITYKLKNSNTASLVMLTSSDGGETFDSASSDYRQWNDATAASPAAEIALGTTQTSSASNAQVGRIWHPKVLGTEPAQFRIEGMFGASRYEIFAIRNASSNAPNALRLAMSSGSMTGQLFVKRIKYPTP